MIRFFVFWLALAFVLARALVLAMPVFGPATSTAFFPNLFVGITSDFAMIFIVGFVFLSLDRIKNTHPGWKAVLYTATTAVSIFLLTGLISHVRYVDHFGMTIRPAHLFSLQTDGFRGASLGILLDSWRFYVLLFVPALLSILAFKIKPDLLTGAKKHPLILLIFAALFNTLNINSRFLDGVHKELRYNPFSAFYFNVKEYQHIATTPLPDDSVLKTVRNLFSKDRLWSDNKEFSSYPLWQTKIYAPEIAVSSESSKVRNDFQEFLKSEEKKKGPWNILVVMLESARASDIGYLNTDNRISLMPRLDKILENGINFTEAIAAGNHTKHGHIAAMCSLYSIPGFPLMITAPMTNAKCLPDIYKEKGYETSFFHAADNHFDNKDIFYQHHRTSQVIGQQNFPEETSRGGWGYSDHALFEKAFKTLGSSTKPFFATILTLTNHLPYKLPSDSPEAYDDAPDNREKVVRYMDWAFDDFYQKITTAQPHTLIILLSDQGVHLDEGIKTVGVEYEAVRELFRIPFAFLTPNMPEHLQGKKLNKIVTNVDMPPTLLSLIEPKEIEQQFMGMDAFLRNDQPIYSNWFENFIKIGVENEVRKITSVHKNDFGTIAVLGHYNLYAPPQY